MKQNGYFSAIRPYFIPDGHLAGVTNILAGDINNWLADSSDGKNEE